MRIMYNSANNFQTKDATAKTQEVGETYYGYKLTLPSSDVDSIVGDELTIEFTDWSFLPVLNIMYAWFKYHTGVRRGKLNPARDSILNRVLDYTSSIYYIMTDMDNSNILYYAKYTGVVPISVPFSQFSSNYNDHDILSFPINFVYSFKEDMNPEILLDFNKVASGRARSLNNYWSDIDGAGGSFFDDNNLPVKYLSTPNNDGKTPYDLNGYSRPMIIHGAYVAEDGKLRQTANYRLVFTN